MTQEVQAPFQSRSCDTAVFGTLRHPGSMPAYSLSPVKGQSGHKPGRNLPTGIATGTFSLNGDLSSNAWMTANIRVLLPKTMGLNCAVLRGAHFSVALGDPGPFCQAFYLLHTCSLCTFPACFSGDWTISISCYTGPPTSTPCFKSSSCFLPAPASS